MQSKKKVKILIVDDHPMTVQGYEIFLKNHTEQYLFEIDKAYTCDEVLLKIKENRISDLALLDISLPPSLDNTIISGEDLGKLLKKVSPKIKIIVHTALSDQQRIASIFKSLKPHGFLVKSDIDPDTLLEAVLSVLKGHTYYSEKTNNLIGSHNPKEAYIDSLDRKILYYLSIGEKMKNLPTYVPLSMPTIERRKKHLKILFGTSDSGDRKLLAIAREKGFI